MPIKHRNLGPEVEQSKDVIITSAQLLALNATPITLIRSPGADKAIIFEGSVVHKPAGTAYAGIADNEDLAFRYKDSSGDRVAHCEPTGFLDQTTDETRYVRPEVSNEFSVSVAIPDQGAAGVDTTNQLAWVAPIDCEITEIKMVPQEVFAGLDASNTVVIDVKRNNVGTAIATETFTTNLAAGSENDFTPLDATTKLLVKGDKVTVDVTAGATANPGMMALLIRYKARGARWDVEPVANEPLVLHLTVGEIITGDSPLELRVYYRVIPTKL